MILIIIFRFFPCNPFFFFELFLINRLKINILNARWWKWVGFESGTLCQKKYSSWSCTTSAWFLTSWENTIFHISELSKFKKNEYKVNDNIIVKPIYVKFQFADMLICTIKAFRYYLKYIRDNNLSKSYLYILGLKLGPFLCFYKNSIVYLFL